jgi:hypothetical protein
MGDGIRERGLKRIGMGLTSGAEKIPHIFVKYSAVDQDPDPHGFAMILAGWIQIQESETVTQKKENVKNMFLKC